MSVRYEMDFSEVDKLEKKFKEIPDHVENLINSYLHVEGAKKVADSITPLIRVSKKNKRHARFSKWWRVRPENLGFTIVARGGAAKNKNSFGYLIFPNEGRGPRNPQEQRFFERGLDRATPKIITDLNERIDQKIEEVLSQ